MHKKKITWKVAALIAALSLVFGCVIGGTVAWLISVSTPLVNTFVASNVSINLHESQDLNLKMLPGTNIRKDPAVTVVGGSEDCWLFVKIEETDNVDSYISYTVDTQWTPLDGEEGVYYMQVPAGDADQTFYILTGQGDGELENGYVSVLRSVTKAQMEAILGDNRGNAPKLTFFAYAIQQEGFSSAALAWEELNG